MENIKILALPRYTADGPSSRVRFFQYIPALEEAGFFVKVEPFFPSSYILALFQNKPKPLSGIIHAYFHRIRVLMQKENFDLIWLQYELLPWLPFWLEQLLVGRKIKLVVDYDDAVFHRYDTHRFAAVRKILGSKIDGLMAFADLVVAGNEYLAGRAKSAGAGRVEILPSVVDLDRYQYTKTGENPDVFTVGWLGSPQTVKFIMEIRNVIRELAGAGIKFVLIGAEAPRELGEGLTESWFWTLGTEAEMILQLDVGVMPLSDSPFEKGKCGYKLIQYMACGLPVVASPVGVNRKLVISGENGYLAENDQQWKKAILTLKNDVILRKKMGEKGRKLVEEQYTLQKTASKMRRLLESLF